MDEGGPDSAEHGWALLLQVVPDGDPALQEARCREAWALGRRHRDPDLECEGQAYTGVMLVQAGRVEEGLVMLDEAVAAICSGEVRDLYVLEGTIRGLFLACERANEVVRAEQWLRAVDDVVRRRHTVGVSAFCRAHYGRILTEAAGGGKRRRSSPRPAACSRAATWACAARPW